jgi:hypothetical protein
MKSLIFLCSFIICISITAKAQPLVDSLPTPIAKDSITPPAKPPKEPYIHQFRLGIDVAKIITSIARPDQKSYEIQLDYALRKHIYIVSEGGWGHGNIDCGNLKYNNNNLYFKLGVDKNFLDMLHIRDFDIAFIGVRYGAGFGSRSEATYIIPSPFGGSVSGITPSQSFFVHWGEITGGLKVELLKGLFIGWNVRMKFLLNSATFKELAPNFIAGYGKGDNSTSFDYSAYLSYAIRWGSNK